MDCADLGEGKPVSEVYKQENPVVKDLCGNFVGSTDYELEVLLYPDSLNLVSLLPETPAFSLALSTDLLIFFGYKEAENDTGCVFSLCWEHGDCLNIAIYDGKFHISGTVIGADGECQSFDYTTTAPTGDHHCAIVTCWATDGTEAVFIKIYIDGEPLKDSFDFLVGANTINSFAPVGDCFFDNITYAKVVDLGVGKDYWGEFTGTSDSTSEITFDDTKLIEYQQKKMAHSDYSKSYTLKEALVKLMDSLNYDLEVGGSLEVTLGGLVWTNGNNITPTNSAGTTLSNVRLLNSQIESSNITDSTISGAEMSESTLDGTNEIYKVLGSKEKVDEWLSEDTEQSSETTGENESVATNVAKKVDELDKTTLKGQTVETDSGTEIIFDGGSY